MCKSEKALSTEHLRGGLKNLAVKSAGVTLFAQGVKFVLQLISVVTLARLLEPADFGLIAMITVFTGVATTFMDGGLSMATIQREHITHAQISNLFWINAGLGLVLFLFAVILAPIVALIYKELRLADIVCIFGLSFLFGGLSVQHDALLKRQMRFKAIAAIDIFSMAAGIVSAIWFAWKGYGYWALVVLPVVTKFTQTIFRWLITGWRPALITRGTGLRPLLNFGLNLTGANLVGSLVSNLTPFLVGFIGGPLSLGFYNRAHKLTSIPTTQLLPPVMGVMQSALARVANEPECFKKAILSLTGKLALVAMFLTISMAVMSDWLVTVFLGVGWEESVPIFRVLSIFSIVEPIASLLAVSLIATGNARAMFRWKIVTLGILVSSLAVGSMWGVTGVVVAYALSGIALRMPLFVLYVSRFLPVSVKDIAGAIIPVMLCASITLILLYALRSEYQPETAIMGLVMFTPMTVCFYFFTLLIMKGPRAELSDLLRLAQQLFRKVREVNE